MIKPVIALALSLTLISCTSTKPVVVEKNVYIPITIDSAFFSEENCTEPSRPPSASPDDPITDTDIAHYMNNSFRDHSMCHNTVKAIKTKSDEAVKKAEALNSAE